MKRRRYVWCDAGLSCGLVVFSLVRSVMFYNGTCTGWPIALGVLLLFPLTGCLLDRRAKASAIATR